MQCCGTVHSHKGLRRVKRDMIPVVRSDKFDVQESKLSTKIVVCLGVKMKQNKKEVSSPGKAADFVWAVMQTLDTSAGLPFNFQNPLIVCVCTLRCVYSFPPWGRTSVAGRQSLMRVDVAVGVQKERRFVTQNIRPVLRVRSIQTNRSTQRVLESFAHVGRFIVRNEMSM